MPKDVAVPSAAALLSPTLRPIAEARIYARQSAEKRDRPTRRSASGPPDDLNQHAGQCPVERLGGIAGLDGSHWDARPEHLGRYDLPRPVVDQLHRDLNHGLAGGGIDLE